MSAIVALHVMTAKETRRHVRLRKGFLIGHRKCWVCNTRPSSDIYSRHGRSFGGLLDPSGWIPVCHQCKEFIHRNPDEARSLGCLR
jgi:hypothetical protein